jgi:hypothetical protein
VSCTITIRDARARATEPLAPYPFMAETDEDLERGLKDVIRLWRHQHPGQDVFEEGITILVEMGGRVAHRS